MVAQRHFHPICESDAMAYCLLPTAHCLLVSYIGPETIVPLTSLLAVIAGVALCGWHWICNFCRRAFDTITGKQRQPLETEAGD